MNDKFRNILIGMGSALVIMPTGSVNHIHPTHKNDADNLAGDWQQVGNDLRSAINQIDNEQEK